MGTTILVVRVIAVTQKCILEVWHGQRSPTSHSLQSAFAIMLAAGMKSDGRVVIVVASVTDVIEMARGSIF